MNKKIKFRVSVVIPVYNAESFLRKSVESALNLVEVGEIILIEDASPDNALILAQQLEQEFEKVKLFQHPDKGNHGAGASRNLGIKKATCEYIAFLDADDYYLPHRFEKDEQVFAKHSDCDGVYSCVGTHFYSEKAKKEFFDKGFGYQEFLTLSKSANPEELFQVLFYAHKTIKGEFHTNGITLKKKIFDKVGVFHTDLKLQQDVHLWKRLAAYCKLYVGQIETPTAMRVIHAENRMTRVADHKQYMDTWWKSLKHEFKAKPIGKDNYTLFEQRYYNYIIQNKNKLTALYFLLRYSLKYPKTIGHSYQDFDFNFWKVFGKNWLTLHIISFKNKIIHKARIKYHQLKRIRTPRLQFDYPIQMNHFYNRKENYFISANSKVMSSTLRKAPNLEHAKLKELLTQNIKKRIGLNRKQKFYLIVRHPKKRLESYFNFFFWITS